MNEIIKKIKQELSEYGEREQHHIYGAEIAEQLLTELNYPKERIEQVKNCVLNHGGSKDRPRNTIEEQCVADADRYKQIIDVLFVS